MKRVLFVLAFSALVMAVGGAEAQDHFKVRRAEAERRSAFQEPGVELRPWGGPTTGTNWWTTLRRSPSSPTVVFVPGRYEWQYGRWIWCPGRYVPIYTSGHRIHIEHRINR